MKENETKIQIKISLTAEEYDILKRLAVLEKKPMSACLLSFVREANTFKVLKKVVTTLEQVQNAKNSIKGAFNDVVTE